MTYCTKDEVRDELQSDSTFHPDVVVDRWIATAEAIIDNELNTTFESKGTKTDKFTQESSLSTSAYPGCSVYTDVFLRKRPEAVGDITSIKLNGTEKISDVSPELFDGGHLRMNMVTFESDIIEVTYSFGLDSVPESIRRLAVAIAARISRIRDAPSVASIKDGEFSTSFKELNPEIAQEIEMHKQQNRISDAAII